MNYHLWPDQPVQYLKNIHHVKYTLFIAMQNSKLGVSARTFGTFRRKMKTAVSRPDEWPGDELRNCGVCEQNDFVVSTQSVVQGLHVNLSIYLSICASVYLSM